MEYKLRRRLSVSPVLAEGMAKTSPLASNLKKGERRVHHGLEDNSTTEHLS